MRELLLGNRRKQCGWIADLNPHALLSELKLQRSP
jgi:hypothetical protein